MMTERLETRKGKRITSRAGTHVCGFTLVELLVVVSIIALLISILLPSLKKAREQAKQVKCLANLSGLSKGNSTYGAEFNGWFVGSPATTGQQLFPKSGGSLDAGAVNTPGDVVQVWDWAGPIAAQKTELHWNRAERWRTTLLTGIFLCPSNDYIAEAFPEGGTPGEGDYDGFGSQPMVSYNTMRAMMTRSGSVNSSTPAVYLQYFHGPEGGTGGVGGSEQTPSSYEPRLERVGNPSEKIFLSDGSRYTTTSSHATPGLIDYSFDWKGSAGGAFSNCAPTAPDSGVGDYLTGFRRSAKEKRFAKYSYRHGNSDKLGLVAIYFDGHGEWMTEAQSRWPDPWWPKGTVLPRTELNSDSQILTRPYWETVQPYSGSYIVRR